MQVPRATRGPQCNCSPQRSFFFPLPIASCATRSSFDLSCEIGIQQEIGNDWASRAFEQPVARRKSNRGVRRSRNGSKEKKREGAYIDLLRSTRGRSIERANEPWLITTILPFLRISDRCNTQLLSFLSFLTNCFQFYLLLLYQIDSSLILHRAKRL